MIKTALARRGFLKLLPAAPLAVRTAAEETAKGLAKVEIAGVSARDHAYPPSVGQPISECTPFQWQQAFKTAGLREKLESLVYENNKYINRIDPDLAVLRSFSLNAKIAFQRQRNVKREIDDRTGVDSYPYGKMIKLILGK